VVSRVRVAVTETPDVAVVDVRLPPTFRDEGVRGGARAAPPRTGPRGTDHRRVLAVLAFLPEAG